MFVTSAAKLAGSVTATTMLMALPLAMCATRARAADLAAPPVVAPPILSTGWASTITHSLQIEGGVVGNPDDPASGKNFGQLYTDRANEFLLNQVLMTVARPIDPAKTWDVGFNLQALFGSDARFDPTLGILDYTLTGRYQAIFTQANVMVHSPFLTPGGLDTRVGLYTGLMGFETTDPSTRPFYTLSYVTNFLVPFQNVGATSTWHVSPTLDIISGIDVGNEVAPWRDNNREPAGYLGFGLNNLLNNKLTVLALSRLGPEDPVRTFGNVANGYQRYWNDVTLTYKATDKWTFVGEANYFKDEGLRSAAGEKATAFGFDGYAAYVYSDELTFNFRGEIYRDNTGLVTTNYLTDTAFTNAIAGFPDGFQNAPPTTFGEITAGVSIKPTALNTKAYKVTIRPEIRYDRSLNGTRPFDDQTKRDQVLISSDFIIAF